MGLRNKKEPYLPEINPNLIVDSKTHLYGTIFALTNHQKKNGSQLNYSTIYPLSQKFKFNTKGGAKAVTV
jgi:hypothetical protein